MKPTGGRIRWSGSDRKGSIGFVFQEPTLMPWATVEKNVWLPFRLGGDSFSSRREDIHKCLELVGLQEFAGELSTRTLGRDAHARLHCTGTGHASADHAHG